MTQKSFMWELGISVVEREQAKQRDGAGGSSAVREQRVAGKPDYASISPPFPKRCDQHCKSTILNGGRLGFHRPTSDQCATTRIWGHMGLWEPQEGASAAWSVRSSSMLTG